MQFYLFQRQEWMLKVASDLLILIFFVRFPKHLNFSYIIKVFENF